MQMAAFFGKSLLSQLVHYLESDVWSQNWGIQGQGIHLFRFGYISKNVLFLDMHVSHLGLL